MKFVIVVIIMLGLFFGGIAAVIYDSYMEDKHHKAMLGEKVVLSNDTLMIMKFNSWSCSYLLINGTEIDETLADKLHLKEQQ